MENKIDIAALGLLPNNEDVEVTIGQAQVIIHKRLSYESLLDMITLGTNMIIGDRNFISAPIEHLISELLIVQYFTNIQIDVFDSIEEIKNEEVYELYDILDGANVFNIVKENIDEQQLKFFIDTLHKTLASIVNYRNSAQGIIDTLAESANQNNEWFTKAIGYLKDKDNFTEVKRMLDASKIE